MKAGEILINGIFNGSRLLEIPFYQRAYVWDDDQWDRFLADMEFVTKTKNRTFGDRLFSKVVPYDGSAFLFWLNRGSNHSANLLAGTFVLIGSRKTVAIG